MIISESDEHMKYVLQEQVTFSFAQVLLVPYRVGGMKLICGDGGRPNGWTLPAQHFHSKEREDLGRGLRLDEDRGFFGQGGTGLSRLCQLGHLPVRLFNLTEDPTEHHDLHNERPEVVTALLDRLSELEAAMIPPFSSDEVEAGNANNFGGFVSTGWCTPQP